MNSSSKTYNHLLINSNALIEHGVVIISYTHISTGLILNCDDVKGEGFFTGNGSIIREGDITLPNTIILLGSRIMGCPLKNKQ